MACMTQFPTYCFVSSSEYHPLTLRSSTFPLVSRHNYHTSLRHFVLKTLSYSFYGTFLINAKNVLCLSSRNLKLKLFHSTGNELSDKARSDVH